MLNRLYMQKAIVLGGSVLVVALASGAMAQDGNDKPKEDKKPEVKNEQTKEAQEPDIKKLALLRIEIPQFEKAYYREFGKMPAEGHSVRVDIRKLEEPFDVYPLACPKAAANLKELEKKVGPIENISNEVKIKEADQVERTYQAFFRFRNGWSMHGRYDSGDISRVALWPGRYSISFAIEKPQGGELSGILPTAKLDLKPGQYDVSPK